MPSSASTRRLLLSKLKGKHENFTSLIAAETAATRSTAATPGYSVTRLMALSAANPLPTLNREAMAAATRAKQSDDMVMPLKVLNLL